MVIERIIISNEKKTKKNKGTRSLQHMPSGHPSKCLPHQTGLNFCDWGRFPFLLFSGQWNKFFNREVMVIKRIIINNERRKKKAFNIYQVVTHPNSDPAEQGLTIARRSPIQIMIPPITKVKLCSETERFIPFDFSADMRIRNIFLYKIVSQFWVVSIHQITRPVKRYANTRINCK